MTIMIKINFTWTFFRGCTIDTNRFHYISHSQVWIKHQAETLSSFFSSFQIYNGEEMVKSNHFYEQVVWIKVTTFTIVVLISVIDMKGKFAKKNNFLRSGWPQGGGRSPPSSLSTFVAPFDLFLTISCTFLNHGKLRNLTLLISWFEIASPLVMHTVSDLLLAYLQMFLLLLTTCVTRMENQPHMTLVGTPTMWRIWATHCMALFLSFHCERTIKDDENMFFTHINRPVLVGWIYHSISIIEMLMINNIS